MCTGNGRENFRSRICIKESEYYVDITYFSLHDEPDSEGHVGARLGCLGAGLVSCRHGLFRWW